MHVQDHLPLDELQRLAQTIPQKRIWRRFQAVIRAHQGDTAEPIAHSLGWSARAVRAWVTKYNRGGPQALHERPHTGRPPRLADADLLRFQERLEAGPTPTDGVCTEWHSA